jgi:hypothetical protein
VGILPVIHGTSISVAWKVCVRKFISFLPSFFLFFFWTLQFSLRGVPQRICEPLKAGRRLVRQRHVLLDFRAILLALCGLKAKSVLHYILFDTRYVVQSLLSVFFFTLLFSTFVSSNLRIGNPYPVVEQPNDPSMNSFTSPPFFPLRLLLRLFFWIPFL